MKLVHKGSRILLGNTEQVWVNETYFITVKEIAGGWSWIEIKRNDKESIHDWRDFHHIKNIVCGKEREALELYPAESRLVDSSNQYHLWVMPSGQRFPFGYGDRLVVKGHKGGYMQSGQRDFKPDEQPDDSINVEDAMSLANEFIKKKEAKQNVN